MYRSERITLRTPTVTLDSFGDAIKTYTSKTVWADRKSATRSEFYTATMAGIRVDAVFSVRAEDYANQTEVIAGAVTYGVVRAYQKDGGMVELTCSVREVAE